LADVALYGDAPGTFFYRTADESALDEYSTAAADAEQEAAVQRQAAGARDAAVVTRILQKATAEAPAEREKKAHKPRLNAEQLQSLAGQKSSFIFDMVPCSTGFAKLKTGRFLKRNVLYFCVG
jgi:hypothetical protein